MRRDFSSLQGKKYDLLVVGGGIYGAWTAYDAALRGLKVALTEQNDWAGATSSASSKLIHGGLRYLEQFDFKLVEKSLSERTLLLGKAPHRIWPLRFGVPVYRKGRIGKLRLKIGLMLYDFLARSKSADAHRHFGRKDFAQRFPFLVADSLEGGFTYLDAQTDDARLVLELVSGSQKLGASCVNYCQAVEFLEKNGQACGAKVIDRESGENAEISAGQVVCATGAWAAGKNPCRLTKGVHVLLPGALGEEALLLTAKSDGRVFFLIPWYGLTLLGTTDTDYKGNPGRVEVEKEDIDYLLKEANAYLKTAWNPEDIVGSYAGLRVLKKSEKNSPSALSRDWELKTAANGLHYSIGGKITSARQDASAIVDTICAKLGIRAPCLTGKKAFPWAPEENYANWLARAKERAKKLGLDEESAQWLIRRHGKNTMEIFSAINNNPTLAERIVPNLPFIYADLAFCAKNEMVLHLEDLLRRRLPLSIMTTLDRKLLRAITEAVSPLLGWDEARLNREMEKFLRD